MSWIAGGNGIGAGRKVTVTQDLGDALSDAAAAAVIHLLGNALMVPYYRCDVLFFPDHALDDRAHEAFSRLTRAVLESNVQRYLYLHGFQTTWPNPGISERDQAIALYERYLPLINYENKQCGLLAAKVLMKEGRIIAHDTVRHPLLPLHPSTRAGLLELAHRLDPLILRWSR